MLLSCFTVNQLFAFKADWYQHVLVFFFFSSKLSNQRCCAGASRVGDQRRVYHLPESKRLRALQGNTVPSAHYSNPQLRKGVGANRLRRYATQRLLWFQHNTEFSVVGTSLLLWLNYNSFKPLLRINDDEKDVLSGLVFVS